MEDNRRISQAPNAGDDPREALELERDRLRKSEAHLAAAQRITQCGSWELDVSDLADVKPTYWSEETFRILGYDPKLVEVSAENFFRVVPPVDAEAIFSRIKMAIETRGQFELDHRVVRLDGTVRIVHIESEIHYDSEGKPDSLIGTTRDVTEQRQNEEAMRRTDERLHAALEAGRMVAWELDFSTQETSVSESAAQVLGLLPGARLDRLDQGMTLVHADDRARLEDAFALAASEGRALDLQFRVIRPDDGRVVWLDLRAKVVRDPSGRITGARGLSTDITDRRQAEEELRVSELRYRTHFEHAPEAISILDMDEGRLIDVNGPAEELFGASRAELLTRHPIVDFSPPVQPDGRNSLDAAREYIGKTLAGELPVFEWMHRNAAGEDRPCEVRLVRVPAGGRNIVRATIIDIRERKRLEELRARSTELELQNRRIQEASRLKSEFLANMSHELRTPLNAIIGFAELLHDGQVDTASPQHKEFLGDILSSGRHLLQLINDILDLSKIEAGKLEFRPASADLAALVGEVCAVLRTAMAQKHMNVEIDIDPMITEVWLDPARFKQVLYNYLSNALKFTGDGGRVWVRTRREDEDHIRLEVEDTGIGIEAREVGRLFQEFEQLESGAAKRHGGTGLGLALTKRLVEAQGGSVGVRSTVGAGSTFHAILPCRGEQERSRPKSTTAVVRGEGPTILVVEDDARDRELIAATLESAGYSVATASTGAEALALCQERTFEAITLDLLLPDMNGLDVLAGLRASRNSAAPVVVITVVADRRVVAGVAVHDILQKPLRNSELLATLERAGIEPGSHGSILVVDNDEPSLRLMSAALTKLGRRAICRSSGMSGLQAAKKLNPAAIILDLLMPEMDGFEFLAQLRKSPSHRQTPVIVWTSKSLTSEEIEYLRDSAQVVLAKSGGINSLVAVLRSALPESAGAGVETP